MIDRPAVCRRLHALERYTAELERLTTEVTRERFDTDLRTQWMIEHGLQLAIECVLDVGSSLVAAEQMGTPESYREVIEILGREGILPPAFVARVLGMPGFRNILMHDYLAVDLSIVWRMLHDGPAQFREFLRLIAEYLKRQAPPS